jgi:hypothetical protein
VRTRLLLTLAAALFLASCGGVSVFSTVGTTMPPSGSTTSTVASGSEPGTTAPPTTAPAAVGVEDWVWSAVAADGAVFGGPGDQMLTAVAPGGPGLVAVGAEFSGDDFDAAVWASPDGITWSRVPHDEAVFGGPDYQEMWSVVAAGPGLIAVGLDGSGGDWDAAVWASPDGTTWSRVTGNEAAFGGAGRQGMEGVVVGGPGLVAFGFDSSDSDYDAAVWTSPDGLVWARVPDPAGLFSGPDDQEARGLAAGGPGLVMVGVDYAQDDGYMAVWTSPDGTTWSQVPFDPAIFGGPDAQLANAVAAVEGGLVAVGTDYQSGEGDAAVWVSPDGVTWLRVAHDEAVFGGAGDQAMVSVALLGTVLVAAGHDSVGEDRDAAVWLFSDGAAWSRVPDDQAIFNGSGSQEAWMVTAGGPGLVVIGLEDTGADRDGLMWIAGPPG